MMLGNFIVHYQSKTFLDQTVEMDGNQFTLCKLDGCVFIVRSTDYFRMHMCEVTNCRFEFKDAAARTIDTLKNCLKEPALNRQEILKMLGIDTG